MLGARTSREFAGCTDTTSSAGAGVGRRRSLFVGARGVTLNPAADLVLHVGRHQVDQVFKLAQPVAQLVLDRQLHRAAGDRGFRQLPVNRAAGRVVEQRERDVLPCIDRRRQSHRNHKAGITLVALHAPSCHRLITGRTGGGACPVHTQTRALCGVVVHFQAERIGQRVEQFLRVRGWVAVYQVIDRHRQRRFLVGV